MNFEAAHQLYTSAKSINNFDVKIEDAFITGILRERSRLDLETVKPICVHNFSKDSVTGKFLEDKENSDKLR